MWVMPPRSRTGSAGLRGVACRSRGLLSRRYGGVARGLAKRQPRKWVAQLVLSARRFRDYLFLADFPGRRFSRIFSGRGDRVPLLSALLTSAGSLKG